ncbi:MAG TPA: DUF1772 domain-containing protein [Paracoccus sp. (in: a-proteobacteria)]|uniref:anthrone oxygenase family protein n=1 Tax=uncultured Paracoccus sp. TaxID=189685 RepID=UPI0026019DC5|nr:anthrone oxygenase family protein [uncultured Paracoccus sp.]HMQ42075.1 DUF1772 domain-containing protein [Paracoccus sp. (in: a-proteobacteria)]HMR35808.1 DUF1772 domain-containing protein [Paracoccus sp. (in: a-proteobacteria)]
MLKLTIPMIFISLLLSAAIFGFFYAWVCSTMWGLDSAEPRVAIAAMQAMNASVRNAVFFPAFFLTPLALAITCGLLYGPQRAPALAFGAAALVYLLGGLILTMAVNVPMNEALALVTIPDDPEAAGEIWRTYSERWQVWNITRTVASGAAFLLAAYGTFLIDRNAL